MRLIDADDLDNVVLQLNKEGRGITRSEYKMLDNIIFEFPTIEAEPVRRGRWIHDGYDLQHGNDWIHCSECGKRGINVPADLTNYCPNCGAKMDVEKI